MLAKKGVGVDKPVSQKKKKKKREREKKKKKERKKGRIHKIKRKKK